MIPADILWNAIWEEGLSLADIAAAHGTTHKTVSAWCRAQGVPYPSREDSRRVKALRGRMERLRKGSVKAACVERAERELAEELDRLWVAYAGAEREEVASCGSC